MHAEAGNACADQSFPPLQVSVVQQKLDLGFPMGYEFNLGAQCVAELKRKEVLEDPGGISYTE